MRRLLSRNAKLVLGALPVAAGCALAKQGDPPLPIDEPGDGGEMATGGSSTSGGTSTGGSVSGTAGSSSGTAGASSGGSAGQGGSTSGGTAGSTSTGGTSGQGGTAGTSTGGSGGSTGGSAGQGGTAGTMTGGTAGSTGGSAGKGGTAGTMTGGTGTGGGAGGPPGGMELLRDNFEMGTGNWTLTPSGVWMTSMDGSTVLGSTGATGSSAMRAATAGQASWTDVQIDARVKVTSFAGTSSGYYAGICARYQSDSNYACFALRSNGQIMFRVSGNNTSAVNPPGGAINEGTWYNVRVVARGANITAFLNGTEIPSGSRVTSGAPTSGRVALACPGTNAVFDDVVVTTP